MIHIVRGPGGTYNWVRKSADLGFVWLMPGYGEIWWTLIHLTRSSPMLDCLNQVAYVAHRLISSDNPTANVPTTKQWKTWNGGEKCWRSAQRGFPVLTTMLRWVYSLHEIKWNLMVTVDDWSAQCWGETKQKQNWKYWSTYIIAWGRDRPLGFNDFLDDPGQKVGQADEWVWWSVAYKTV